jgi:hypothetical protein
MRHAARITLFVQDRDGRLDTYPDLEVLHALMQQVPLVTRNADGSRTLVFDLADPAGTLGGSVMPEASEDRLRTHMAATAAEARALGLKLTAALAESAELVAELELAREAEDTPPARD